MLNTSASNHDLISQNWSTVVQFQADQFHAPETVEEVQEIVAQATKVKVVGSGHCFNNIADTTGALLSLKNLDETVTFDKAKNTATIPAGMTYIELAPVLDREGYALRNMASLPHISVIGACMTATHGSGDQVGNLATQIVGLEMVKADGELVQLSRETEGERFDGMVVSLGALGVVTKVTLELVPAFSMRQQIYRGLPLADMAANFDAIMSSGYSVSLFTPWRDKIVNQVWVKQIVPNGEAAPIEPDLFGATLATEKRNPLDGTEAESCNPQLGEPGPWYERLPHFHFRSKLIGEEELQTEYFVDRKDAVNALLTVESLIDKMAPVLKVTEIRSMTADNLWLSMAYGRDTIGIHISWYHHLDEVMKRLPILEQALEPYAARPHWGKLYSMPSEQVSALYERMPDFRTLCAEFDPERKFVNAFLQQYL